MRKRKSVDIITFHTAHNYGAMLQAYALQTILSKKYDTKIIDYRNDEFKKVYSILKFNKKNIFTIMKSCIANIVYFRRRYKRRRAFEKFKNNYMKLTDKYETQEQLKQNPPKCDVYVTGSDQVWNYKISGKKIDAYTLNFGNDKVKRIAYAASIGTKELEKKHKNEYIEKINRLQNITVREKEAKTCLENYINKPIEVVLDPTLLLKKEQWEDLIQSDEKDKEKYILSYVVGNAEEYFDILNYLSQATGLKVIYLGIKNREVKNLLRSEYTKGPKDFIKLIKNAEYIVTTSFHAIIFSILFNKKFWVVLPQETSSRITDILTLFNLKDRAVYSLNQFRKKKYDDIIDYKKVEKIISNKRNESMKILENAIEGEKYI